MKDVNRAYEILGANPSMSLEEIEAAYERLVDGYTYQTADSMTQEKLIEWADAFECIVEHRIDISQRPAEESRAHKVGITVLKVVALFIFAFFIVKEITWLEKPSESALEGGSVQQLSNNFELILSKFDESGDWDWGYYEQNGEWTVVVAIKVSEADEAGALVNAGNFQLGEAVPSTVITQTIYSDEEVNHLHYLGGYSELIPANQKFAITFNVVAFMPGEERVLYYHFPDGRKIEVGRLKFEGVNGHEDHGILV